MHKHQKQIERGYCIGVGTCGIPDAKPPKNFYFSSWILTSKLLTKTLIVMLTLFQCPKLYSKGGGRLNLFFVSLQKSRGGLAHNSLIDYFLFYVPLVNISLIWRRHHYQWRAAKFRRMLDIQGLWAGRDLYRATPAVTRGLGLIWRTAPFSRPLWYTRGCGKSILTRILMGCLAYDVDVWRYMLTCIYTFAKKLGVARAV
jgi:hypothetical protein